MSYSKKELASTRNWLKARLLGFPFNQHNTPLTDAEQGMFNEIRDIRNALINNWDDNSRALGMNVKPRKHYWERQK